MMQMTINVPDTLPTEFLKLRIQEFEQNLINEAQFFADFTKSCKFSIETNIKEIKDASNDNILLEKLYCRLHSAKSMIKSGELEQAKIELENIVEEAPALTEDYVYLGDIAFYNQEYKKALDLYDLAFKNEPLYQCINDSNNKHNLDEIIEQKNSNCNSNLKYKIGTIGQCYLKLGNIRKSIEYYELKRKLNKNEESNALGDLYLEIGDYENAEEHLLKQSLWDEGSLYSLALLYFKQKKTIKAITNLRIGFIKNIYIATALLKRSNSRLRNKYYCLSSLKYEKYPSSNLFDVEQEASLEEGAEYYLEDGLKLWKGTNGAISFLKFIYNHPIVKAEIDTLFLHESKYCKLGWDNPERNIISQQIEEIKKLIDDESSEKILTDLKIT